MGESCASAYSSRLCGQEKLEQGERWWVHKCKGQVCRNAESETTEKTKRMLEPDLGKWSIACGNSGLQGKDSMEANTGDLPDLRKQRGTIKTSKDAVTNKELSSKCGSIHCYPLYLLPCYLLESLPWVRQSRGLVTLVIQNSQPNSKHGYRQQVSDKRQVSTGEDSHILKTVF